MTTCLLHGGATSKDLLGNDRFFAQFTELVDKNEVKILLCYWASNRDEWSKLADRDTIKIKNNVNKQISFYVVEDVADLFSKVDDYDVIYVAGGKAKLLEPYYKDLSQLKEKLDDKIYIGSSMGAFLASDSYVLSFNGPDFDTKHEGVGLLPIQILCHWDVEEQKEMKLSLLDKDKPIVVLNEGEFVTIYRK